mgnify:CR=1 FL=1
MCSIPRSLTLKPASPLLTAMDVASTVAILNAGRRLADGAGHDLLELGARNKPLTPGAGDLGRFNSPELAVVGQHELAGDPPPEHRHRPVVERGPGEGLGIGAGGIFATFFTAAGDIIPPERRSQGIAFFGISGMAAGAAGPPSAVARG